MTKEENLLEEIKEIQNKMKLESPINPCNNISQLKDRFYLKQAELKGFKQGRIERDKEWEDKYKRLEEKRNDN